MTFFVNVVLYTSLSIGAPSPVKHERTLQQSQVAISLATSVPYKGKKKN